MSDAEIKERLKKVEVPKRKRTPLLESYREKFTGVNCYDEKEKVRSTFIVFSSTVCG
ncbi:MAG: hypothetical protein KAT65_18640 [Methanophagales archaeon]|nr:hypothetical protein [Methanophagales archaeon]